MKKIKRLFTVVLSILLVVTMLTSCKIINADKNEPKWTYQNESQKTVFHVEYSGGLVYFDVNKHYNDYVYIGGKKPEYNGIVSDWMEDVGIKKWKQIDHMEISCTTTNETLCKLDYDDLFQGEDIDLSMCYDFFRFPAEGEITLEPDKTYTFRFEFFDKDDQSLWQEDVKCMNLSKPDVTMKEYEKSGKTYHQLTVTSAKDAAYIEFEYERNVDEDEDWISDKTLKYKENLHYTVAPTEKGKYTIYVTAISKYGDASTIRNTQEFTVK